MARGLFTQGLVVLFNEVPTLDALAAKLPVAVLERTTSSERWEISGPSLVVELDRARNGLVAIDVVSRPWPDDMGSPRESPTLFGAWSMGHFGPFAFPAGLARATQHAYHWPESPRELAAAHRAFVRLRASYAFGVPDDAPVIPEGVDPVRELEQLLSLARALLDVKGATLLFVPGAELLFDAEQLDSRVEDARELERPALDLWSNVRMFRLDARTLLMDTTGLALADRMDLEAVFPAEIPPGEVAGFLRNLSLYVLGAGDVLRVGNTVDGPGGVWVVLAHPNSKTEPPRPVVRLAPKGFAPPGFFE